MNVEIERKYLVSDQSWRKCATTVSAFRQAYIAVAGDRTVRIRTINARRATLTVKIRTGPLEREEFEYDLPYCEALRLMGHRIGVVLEKNRYDVIFQGHSWEVDVYEGVHHGLVVAEIELRDAKDTFPQPIWLGREITGERSYSNRILAMTQSDKFFPKAPVLDAVQ